MGSFHCGSIAISLSASGPAQVPHLERPADPGRRPFPGHRCIDRAARGEIALDLRRWGSFIPRGMETARAPQGEIGHMSLDRWPLAHGGR